MSYPGFMGFGWIFMVLFWGAVIYFVIWLIRKNSESNSMEILKQRLAKGEISKKEFKDLKKELA